jgi:GT2 family glycosyltransferase
MIDVVIVSWNTRGLLRDCLNSIIADPLVSRIVVVDNASHDGSVTMVQSEFPRVICLAESVNHGFAKGNNVGLAWLLAHDPAPYVCCLNPDTVVQPGAFATLVEALARQPQMIGCGPELRYGDGSLQSSRRRFPTLGTYLFESTPWGRMWTSNPWQGWYRYDDTPADTEQSVDWLVGAVLLFRTDIIVQRGLFDPRFALYAEEVEWQRRLSAGAGSRMLFVPQAQVIHFEGQSSKQMPVQRQIWFYQSRLREAFLAYGMPTMRLVQVCLWLMFVGELLIETIKWALGHKRTMRSERMTGYRRLLAALRHPDIISNEF